MRGSSHACGRLLQVAVTIGLQYIDSSLSTLVNPEDPESESEGWILEKTVKETFTDIMDKMKSMGKGTKVEEGEEAGVATVSWAKPSTSTPRQKTDSAPTWRAREEGRVRSLHFSTNLYVDTNTQRMNGLLSNGLLACIIISCILTHSEI